MIFPKDWVCTKKKSNNLCNTDLIEKLDLEAEMIIVNRNEPFKT